MQTELHSIDDLLTVMVARNASDLHLTAGSPPVIRVTGRLERLPDHEQLTPEEIRTPALWGLRVRRPLLHDGRAATIDEAVRMHRGEAELALRGFERLSAAQQSRLLAFLRSL